MKLSGSRACRKTLVGALLRFLRQRYWRKCPPSLHLRTLCSGCTPNTTGLIAQLLQQVQPLVNALVHRHQGIVCALLMDAAVV